MLAGWELALGLAAMFFGAIVLGTISFGLGTVAMPFMLFILPPRDAVVIVNAVVVLTTGLTVVQTWRHLNLRESWSPACLRSHWACSCCTVPMQWH
ncbi:MAG: hypothetical protein OXL37_16080 [Chloroflexota bacterium]|nr:hypothetical protein [Chloroflexota bacterium]MDE2959827.1 hypothetical protein [Chloroflexota bacterium]